MYILLYFRFWGTCEEHARLLHRYIYGNVVCCLPPQHLYLTFLPTPDLPTPYTDPALPLTTKRPKCVMLPSLCPRILIVQHQPVSENMQCLMFCSCVSLLRMMVSGFINAPPKDTNSSHFTPIVSHSHSLLTTSAPNSPLICFLSL